MSKNVQKSTFQRTTEGELIKDFAVLNVGGWTNAHHLSVRRLRVLGPDAACDSLTSEKGQRLECVLEALDHMCYCLTYKVEQSFIVSSCYRQKFATKKRLSNFVKVSCES